MRKIAAHYWLRPDGTIGRFPIVEIDNDGVILNVRERERFLEEPFLELINGLLCPGFISVFSDSFFTIANKDLSRFFNQQVISGVKAVGISKNVFEELRKYFIRDLLFFKYTNINSEVDIDDVSLLEGFKNKYLGVRDLQKYTLKNAQLLGVDDVLGSIEVGKSPGIIALSGVDYNEMKLTTSTKVKLII